MPNAAYQRGSQRERDWRERRESQGYVVAKAGGSKGPYDLMACRLGEVVLDQVKSDKKGPYANFGPAKRAALIEAGHRAGAKVFLIWWPPDRQGPRIIPAEDWPGEKDGI